MHSLTQRSDERPLNVLRLELEQARAAIDSLAREDTVRSIGSRWDDFERRMSSFEDNMSAELRSRAPSPSVDALNDRLEQMQAALSGLPESLPLRALDEKIRKLSGAVEQFVQRQETRQPQPLIAIETRLDEISRAIVASAVSGAGAADAEQMKRIEARISALSRQIEETAQGAPLNETFDRLESISRRVETVADRLDTTRASEDAIMGIEERLAGIAARLDRPVPAAPAVDPTLVANLEAQIAGLSQFLSRQDPQREDLSPRLEMLERSVVGNRDLMVEAAREAAERAVHSLDGAPRGDVEAVSGLADDLKKLEGLTRRSDERNSKTFEAIHDTLLKIVDRLGSLDHGEAAVAEVEPRRKFELPQTPPMDLTLPEELEEEITVAEERPQWTPAQAAAAAAEAALEEPIAETAPAKPRRSMLGSLFGRKTEEESPQLPGMEVAEPEIPTVDLDEPLDPGAANRPLEPGSGAPDLNAIMRRVRDSRGGDAAKQADADAAKTDFIAAARRAAQAAAAEAEVMKRNAGADKAGGKGGSLAEMLKARRKPILMAAAAVMIALAGLQLGKSFLNDPTELAGNGTEAPAGPAAEGTTAEPQQLAEQAPVEEPADVRQAAQKRRSRTG